MLQLYIDTFGTEPASITPLSGAGSNRQYFRLADSNGNTVIGVMNENVKENRAFVAFARQMYAKNINVPQIIAVADDERSYLQEDLGDVSLYSLIEKAKKEGNPWNEELVSILHQVMKDLPRIQFETADGMDFSVCMVEKNFSSRTIRWDLNYFKYCFLKMTGIEFDEKLLEDDFDTLLIALISVAKFGRIMPNLINILTVNGRKSNVFLYRDFQSRNIMVKDGKPYYIDFQGGYRGPIYYDIVSFINQTRADYPPKLCDDLLSTYYNSLKVYYKIELKHFKTNYILFMFFRLLQVLGTYGFRGLHEHKTMFISPIVKTLDKLNKFPVGCPYLCSLIKKIPELPQFKEYPAKGGLTVRVTSFSYKKGIPEDYSGNGGGFVFDCRAPHNPGRYPEYKMLTGLDKPVIDFLESEDSMPNFISHAYALVDPAVETYLQREFTSLVVNFGCTGGQHRSVYCAQHLAEHLAEKYPAAKILLSHRELGINKEYN